MTAKRGGMNGHLYQAAAVCAAAAQTVLPRMKYIDLHCDALTKKEGVLQVQKNTLMQGGCLLQCFAAFISARENRFSAATALFDSFDEMCTRESYHPVRRFSDVQEGEINALLTVEEGGGLEGSLEKLQFFYERGVRMMTLTWNYENEIGFPNLNMGTRTPPPTLPSPLLQGRGRQENKPDFTRRERERGLTAFGFDVVECMAEMGMLIDVSHGSDKLFSDVSEVSRRKNVPFVASHSGAAAVHDCSRNLTDEQIKTLADCGGVIGLLFCADFLSNDLSAAGQREAILKHAAHIIKVGGEDVLAIGSDFDGIPENAYMKNAADMPRLSDEFERRFGSRIAEKIAHGNAMRIFQEVLK